MLLRRSCQSRLVNSRNFCSSEKWAYIDGYARYQVSSFGNVRNRNTGKLHNIHSERSRKINCVPSLMIVSDANKCNHVIISRLVLSSFKPNINADNEYPIHLDGDRFNNQLSNLKWSDTTGSNKVKVIATSTDGTDDIHFDSIKECADHFNVASDTMSRWCANKAVRSGYQFTFVDSSRYCGKVSSLENEDWKLFHESDCYYKYYISSHGRVKSVSSNGKERLIKSLFIRGYHSLSGLKSYIGTRRISRLVAIHHVENVYNYKYVDHIDCDTLNNHATNLRWVEYDTTQLNKNWDQKQRIRVK